MRAESSFTYLSIGVLVVLVGLLADLNALSIFMTLVAAFALVALISALLKVARWARDLRRTAAPLVRSGGFASFRTETPRPGQRSPQAALLHSGGFSLLRDKPANNDRDKWTRT